MKKGCKHITQDKIKDIFDSLDKGISTKEIINTFTNTVYKYNKSTIYRIIKAGTQRIISKSSVFVETNYETWLQKQNKINEHKMSTINNNRESIWKHFIQFAQIVLKKHKGKYSAYALLVEYKRQYPSGNCPSKKQLYNWAHQNKYGFHIKQFIRIKKKKCKLFWKNPTKPMKFDTIENRIEAANKCLEPGHFELDTVRGLRTDKTCLLTMVDRKTKEVYIRLIKATAKALLAAVIGISRITKIKSITMDNGCENNFLGKLRNILLYNCHAYCSWEKGIIESMHRQICKWIPKGQTMNNLTKYKVSKIEKFINSYPSTVPNAIRESNFLKKIRI